MSAKLTCLLSLVVVASAAPQEKDHNLPVLFQFSQPSHNVAVFRGADLKKAIAAGLVPGFGSLGNSANSANNGDEGRDGRSDDGDDSSDGGDGGDGGDGNGAVAASYVEPATEAPTTAAPAYTPAPTPVVYRPAPIVYKPAPVVYKPAPAPVIYKPAPAPIVYKPAPAPVVYKPAPVVYKPAPAPVVYKPAPAPVIVKPVAPKYKPAPYVEPAYAQDAVYTWEYAVKDDYTNNDFGAKEARDGYLTNGKYYVALPDGRFQTVTYTVNGDEGYVPVVEYTGEAQYPPIPAPYSS